mmetsp:Transcript_34963/g.69780  ORF Transcript_34963/g.69780 Transcript_34963/m.69780 type:complete len:235 (-) Transcript_34963:809-1513(-)
MAEGRAVRQQHINVCGYLRPHRLERFAAPFREDASTRRHPRRAPHAHAAHLCTAAAQVFAPGHGLDARAHGGTTRSHALGRVDDARAPHAPHGARIRAAVAVHREVVVARDDDLARMRLRLEPRAKGIDGCRVAVLRPVARVHEAVAVWQRRQRRMLGVRVRDAHEAHGARRLHGWALEGGQLEWAHRVAALLQGLPCLGRRHAVHLCREGPCRGCRGHLVTRLAGGCRRQSGR